MQQEIFVAVIQRSRCARWRMADGADSSRDSTAGCRNTACRFCCCMLNMCSHRLRCGCALLLRSENNIYIRIFWLKESCEYLVKTAGKKQTFNQVKKTGFSHQDRKRSLLLGPSKLKKKTRKLAFARHAYTNGRVSSGYRKFPAGKFLWGFGAARASPVSPHSSSDMAAAASRAMSALRSRECSTSPSILLGLHTARSFGLRASRNTSNWSRSIISNVL